MSFPLTVNGFQYIVDVEPETPLLWAIRDAIDLTGTKFVALLQRTPAPADADIDTGVTNACRCGTYHRVRQGIHRAAALMSVSPSGAGGEKR
jgi:aerobic-type carbon monoxide dehydrogenase small subunit (CoxS/CutS family)